MVKKANRKINSTANLGFEEKLWAVADKLRSHKNPSEYKHVVLGLIFQKYISDRFSTHRGKLEREIAAPGSVLCIAKEKARYETLELCDTLLPKLMRGELRV